MIGLLFFPEAVPFVSSFLSTPFVSQFLDACEKFGIVNVERSQNAYVGALVLQQPLDYRERPFYQLLLRASVSRAYRRVLPPFPAEF